MAEFELALTQERVRAGLRNAQSKGVKLGRPRVAVDAGRIASLRSLGRSWAAITTELGIGEGTARRAGHSVWARITTKSCSLCTRDIRPRFYREVGPVPISLPDAS